MRNTYIEGLEKELPHPFRSAADRVAKQFDTDAEVKDGIVRWRNNGNIPPHDILEYWRYIGKDFNMNRTLTTDEVETREFFEQYRIQEKNHTPSEEEMFEMTAAFGEGAVVKNIITGRQVRL